MKKQIITLLAVVIATFVFTGCGADIEEVKERLGATSKAVDEWVMCKEVKWKIIEALNGKEWAQATCVFKDGALEDAYEPIYQRKLKALQKKVDNATRAVDSRGKMELLYATTLRDTYVKEVKKRKLKFPQVIQFGWWAENLAPMKIHLTDLESIKSKKLNGVSIEDNNIDNTTVNRAIKENKPIDLERLSKRGDESLLVHWLNTGNMIFK